MSSTVSQTLTIGRLAKAAGVGVETIRYYQERQLLPVPPTVGSYRHYPIELIERIRFIKRAQELGFTLDEIASLLLLQDGTDKQAVREIANTRVEQINTKIADLQRMQHTLNHLLDVCQHTARHAPCPIIACLAMSEKKGVG